MREKEKENLNKKFVYLMTVGTGTAGKTSNLAQGLVNAINLRKNQLKSVLLMPSESEDSVGIAELVIEELKESGLGISIVAKFSQPDGLLICRREVREVLAGLKKDKIAINPTSGTKQMTAGATLAALDMGFGVIEFITGDRRDGVVITGTERIQSVDAARLQAEQSIRNILVLLENGDYTAASILGERVKAYFPETTAICNMLSAWNRMNYSQAARSAPSGETFSEVRRVLGRLSAASPYSLERIADLLALANRELTHSRSEEALSSIYRSVELMSKFHLVELGCPPEQWFADNICGMFKMKPGLQKKFLSQQINSNNPISLGLKSGLDILDNTDFSLCKLQDNKKHWNVLMMRNETRFGHGDKSVNKDDVKKLNDAVYSYAVEEWVELRVLIKESEFPQVEGIIRKEINNESE